MLGRMGEVPPAALLFGADDVIAGPGGQPVPEMSAVRAWSCGRKGRTPLASRAPAQVEPLQDQLALRTGAGNSPAPARFPRACPDVPNECGLLVEHGELVAQE